MISFLRPELLSSHRTKADSAYVREVRRALNHQSGWHYPLDLVWIVGNIRQAVPPGSTVLDVGAGRGLLQFLLAGLGYNVVSLDLVRRNFGRRLCAYFSIDDQQDSSENTTYAMHLSTSAGRTSPVQGLLRYARTLAAAISGSSLRLYRNRRNHGSITLIVGDVTKRPHVQWSVDAIVSLSALEHIPDEREFLESIRWIQAFHRPYFITTSAAPGATWWHEPSKGWCFGPDTLAQVDSVPADWDAEYHDALAAIKGDTYLKTHIPDMYTNNPHCGLPYGVWDPQYVPIGLSR